MLKIDKCLAGIINMFLYFAVVLHPFQIEQKYVRYMLDIPLRLKVQCKETFVIILCFALAVEVCGQKDYLATLRNTRNSYLQ